MPIRITIPGVPDGETVTHGSFLYIASLDNWVSQGPYWSIEDEGDLERTDVWCAADTPPTSPAPQMYWAIKHADPSLASVGQPIFYGDTVYLESRYIPSMSNWLPGKLIPNSTKSSPTYLTVTRDAGYSDVTVGRWVLEPAS